ncbi:MAG: PIG-L family deacetylase [Tannerellaceae bacterium]|jgi:LmbE family N-acetylglucosaminyl deacetylase|nr:PIG-L family deacetylase [Tannerellaceae bacterium]
MKTLILFTAFLFFSVSLVSATEPLRVIMFGAHPDDCDISGGGTAALFAQMGHKVKFVSLTNGDKGHHLMKPEELAARRKQEMQEVARILHIEYDNLDNHDGELMPTLENRKAVIQLICDWKADIVITHRPNDYHPDHRYTSTIVQDAAYMISVPLMVEKRNPLLLSPVFLYFPDRFQKPNPFSPDIVIDIASVAKKKLDAICAHESQVFEWLPWNNGYESQMPAGKEERREFTGSRYLSRYRTLYSEAAAKWYTPEQLNDSEYFEAFEICEYGRIPDEAEIKRLFPMLPQ